MTKNKSKILIVEDEKPMLETLKDKCNKEGWDVFVAQDGEEGLNIAFEEKPEIILLDIVMPKLDGMEFMKKIRDDEEWGKNVPVIMLTNLSDPNAVAEASKYQVFDFLVKTDWRLDDIMKLIHERLGK